MAYPINNSFFEREGTNKVFHKEKEGERATFMAPITEYVMSLALAMQVLLSGDFSIESCKLKVIWSDAPKSIIQPVEDSYLE